MRKKGFEPSQALSHESLNLARLTTPALPHDKSKLNSIKKLTNSPTRIRTGVTAYLSSTLDINEVFALRTCSTKGLYT